MNYGRRISAICLYNSAVEMDIWEVHNFKYTAITQVLALSQVPWGGILDRMVIISRMVGILGMGGT